MKKILKLAVLIGGVAAAAKLVGMRKAEWEGLSESDVRAKLDARLPDKVPADKRAAIADKVVGTMRDRNMLREDSDS